MIKAAVFQSEIVSKRKCFCLPFCAQFAIFYTEIEQRNLQLKKFSAGRGRYRLSGTQDREATRFVLLFFVFTSAAFSLLVFLLILLVACSGSCSGFDVLVLLCG